MNTMNYIKTPSFYTNEDYFSKYLGGTSYYKELQKATRKLIELTKPKCVMELGSALGTTTNKLAKRFPAINFVGFDVRGDIINSANEKAKDLQNVTYAKGDMERVVMEDLSGFDFIFMLYSFHHIPDPNFNKVEFLRNCYENMSKGSYLMIGETFLPEDGMEVRELFKFRGREGYASTFWSCLDSLDKVHINMASVVGQVSKKEELKAGELVDKRDNEYLVEATWVVDTAVQIGFEFILNEPLNAIGERVILLRR